eukprot:m.268397 g.268397  ORF g.268397 m.268397 type:complete len:80 (-) comp74010_c0_seq1:9-248(-)
MHNDGHKRAEATERQRRGEIYTTPSSITARQASLKQKRLLLSTSLIFDRLVGAQRYRYGCARALLSSCVSDWLADLHKA